MMYNQYTICIFETNETVVHTHVGWIPHLRDIVWNKHTRYAPGYTKVTAWKPEINVRGTPQLESIYALHPIKWSYYVIPTL